MWHTLLINFLAAIRWRASSSSLVHSWNCTSNTMRISFAQCHEYTESVVCLLSLLLIYLAILCERRGSAAVCCLLRINAVCVCVSPPLLLFYRYTQIKICNATITNVHYKRQRENTWQQTLSLFHFTIYVFCTRACTQHSYMQCASSLPSFFLFRYSTSIFFFLVSSLAVCFILSFGSFHFRYRFYFVTPFLVAL